MSRSLKCQEEGSYPWRAVVKDEGMLQSSAVREPWLSTAPISHLDTPFSVQLVEDDLRIHELWTADHQRDIAKLGGLRWGWM